MALCRWFVGLITLLLLAVAVVPSPASASSLVPPVTVGADTTVTQSVVPAPVGGAAPGRVGTSGSRSSQRPAHPTTGTVHAASAASNPAKNIPPSPAFPDRCYQAYQSAACTNAAVAALNHARLVMGLPAYLLPANFALLPPAYQFLALSNADRKLAGLTQITAFNPTLNSVAQRAANASADPSGASVPAVIAGQQFTYWTANWAGGMSPLEAYYDWMYYDGYGSNNLDCATPADDGCWGHREDTLWNFGAGAEVAMGVGTAFSGKSYGSSWAELYWGYVPTPASAHIPRLPAVYSIAAASGPAAGGTTVTLSGYGLEKVSSVRFGTKVAFPVTKLAGSLTVRTPAGSGVVTVQVNSVDGLSVATSAVTFSFLAAAGPGSFVPKSPTRLLDTRVGLGARKARLSNGNRLVLQVTGRGGIPASGVSTVVLSVTAVNPTGAGYLTVYPNRPSPPGTSNLSYVGGRSIANLVAVPVSSDGRIAFYNRSVGAVDVVADLAGYYVGSGTPTAAGAVVAVTPARLLDTRTGRGAPKARVAATQTLGVTVLGHGGIPSAGVAAVMLNINAVDPATGGYLTAWASGGPRPAAANLNFFPRQSVAALVLAKIGAGGRITIFNGSAAQTDIVADVVGYVKTGSAAAVVNTRGATIPVAPSRTFDSRSGGGVATFPPYDITPPAGQPFVVDAGYSVPLLVLGRHGIPATGVVGVVLTVTVVAPRAAGFYTVYPDGPAMPRTSNFTFGAGRTTSNTVIVAVPRDGLINLYNGSASFGGLTVDVTGYVLG